jgi:hypothetical protein
MLADLVHLLPRIKQSESHRLIVAVLPLIGGSAGELGITERIRGESQEADRAWTPGWICERICQSKCEKMMTNGG